VQDLLIEVGETVEDAMDAVVVEFMYLKSLVDCWCWVKKSDEDSINMMWLVIWKESKVESHNARKLLKIDFVSS